MDKPPLAKSVLVDNYRQHAAIFYHPWEDAGSGKIRGHWAEDDSTYDIFCPHQLQSSIIAMQNALCRRYAAIEDKSRELAKLQRELNSLLASLG